MRSFLGGVLAALVLVLVVVWASVQFALVPARADGPLMPGERWAAKTSLAATIKREAPQPPYPVSTPSDTDIAQGARLSAHTCRVGQAPGNTAPNAGGGGIGIRPPQFGKHGVDD